MVKKPNPREQWNNYNLKYAYIWTKKARIPMLKKEMNFVMKFITPNTKKVLDVGCGTGRVLDEYCKQGKDFEIYGIDIAEKMVEICNKKRQGCSNIKDIRVCDISKEIIPYNINFDIVSAIRVFKYNKNWRQIFKKLITRCSMGGIVIFTIPNRQSINRLAGFANIVLRKDNNYYIYRSSYTELKKICDNLDCQIIEISSFSKIPDFFYDFSESKILSSIVLRCEYLLEFLFGKIMFGKELFIAVKKR